MNLKLFLCVGGSLLLGFGLTYGLGWGLRNIETETLRHKDTETLRHLDTGASFLYSAGEFGRTFFDTAYEKADGNAVEAPRGVRSIVVPHHLLVADRIAALFTSVASRDVKTVIVLSPNHFSRGRTPISLSEGVWQTPYGRVETDVEAVQLLEALFSESSSRTLSIDETPFSGEHGVGALTPFLARSFPKAKIIPILFDESALGREEVTLLMQHLADLRPDAFLVASVDFSHYLPTAVQVFHDNVSLLCLKRGVACQPLDGSIDLEVDSNVTLGALKVWNHEVGAETFTEAFHTSSLGIIPSGSWSENTSHIGGWFSDGNPSSEPFSSFQMVGDVMLDRGTRLKINEFGVSYPWEQMTRFLRGTSRVVGNLEGTVNERESRYTYDPPFQFVFSPDSVAEAGKWLDLVSLANNHVRDVGIAGEVETRARLDEISLPWFGSWSDPSFVRVQQVGDLRIAFVGYHAFAPNEDGLVKAIKQARTEAGFVVVMPHWGVEYETVHSSEQRRLAKRMIDAGADLIVGSHPHVVQDMEVIDGVPVVYSLGNFVFDQQIPATWTGLTLGVTVDAQFVTLYPIPVRTRDGQPTPLSDTEANPLISRLTSSYGYPIHLPRVTR